MNKEIIENLKKPNTLTRLRFKEIISETNKIIKVAYYGHEVGGSYVNDYEVAPGYVEDLEYSTNRRVKWTGRDCGCCLGADVYYFDVFVNEILNPKPYVPKGEILRVANSYIPFEKEGGEDWALLYISHRAILNNEIPDKIMTIKNNIIYFGNNKIAYVIEYEPETYHTFQGHNTSYGRTHFHAIYDLLISTNKFQELFFKYFKEIVNRRLKDTEIICEKVYIRYDYTYGDKIHLVFNTGKHYSIGSDWYIFNEKDAEQIKNDKKPIHISVLFGSNWPPDHQEYFIDLDKPRTLQELLKGYKPPYYALLNNERTTDFTKTVKNKDKVEFVYRLL